LGAPVIKRLKWIEIPEKDFYRLEEAFSSELPYLSDELINLIEKYKLYATDYDGKRFVFVSVRDMERRSRRLAGFIIYDKSSKRILFRVKYDNRKELVILSFLRLVLRMAMDNRFDVIETLLSIPQPEIERFILLLGVGYRHLGDELIDYLYKNYRDVVERYRKNWVIYGRNFVFTPEIEFSYNVFLMKLSDGTILAQRVSRGMGVYPAFIVSKDSVVYEPLSLLVDYAEDLDRNLVLYEHRCGQTECKYIAVSSIPSRDPLKRSAVLLVSIYTKDLSGDGEFTFTDIYLTSCDTRCKAYSIVSAANEEFIRGQLGMDLGIDLGSELERLFREGKIKQPVIYIIAYKDRFPKALVDKAYEIYLNENIMNIVS